MSDPACLIVMPSYCKTEPDFIWLKEALQSIKAQTYSNFKLLVADSSPLLSDCGLQIAWATSVLEMVEEFGYTYIRFDRVITGDVSNKINVAAETTRSKYIVVMSHDDYISPWFLEKQINILESDPTLAFTQPDVVMFGSKQAYWSINPDMQVMHQLTQNQFAGTCVIRRDVFDSFGGYDTRMCPDGHWVGLEDFFLFVQMLSHGWKYKITSEPLLFARCREGQASSSLYGTQKYRDLIFDICKIMGFEAEKKEGQVYIHRAWTMKTPTLGNKTGGGGKSTASTTCETPTT